MASSYKYLAPNDRVVSSTDLYEELDLAKGAGWTGTILPNSSTPAFVKYTSGSTNIFDVTIGRSADTTGSSATLTREKANYNQMAKVLLGHDVNGNILKFSLDADADTGNRILHNAFFVNFGRTQFKDKVRKGYFDLLVNVSGALTVHLADTTGAVGPIVRECQTGEVGLLFVSGESGAGVSMNSTNVTGGLVFYEAGIAVVSPYIFAKSGSATPPSSSNADFNENTSGILTGLASTAFSGSSNIGTTFVASTALSSSAYGFSTALNTASFQAATELNSTVYFCRAFNNEFNYSSNPTYLNNGEIYVKEGDPMNQPVSYITSVGLYDDNNQLLAVAKLSEPIKKTPDTELIARVRLDF